MGWAKERHFELALVINPEYAEQTGKIAELFRKAIKGGGGRLTREEEWGRRQFAYRIDNYSKGYYLLLNFAAKGREAVDAIEENLENNDSILRSLLSRTAGPAQGPSPIELAIQAKAAEEEAS